MNRRSVLAAIGGLLAYLGLGRRGGATPTENDGELCFLVYAPHVLSGLTVFASSWREAEAKIADLAVIFPGPPVTRITPRVDGVCLIGDRDERQRRVLAHQADPGTPDCVRKELPLMVGAPCDCIPIVTVKSEEL